jgi:hypothetical protein
MGAGPKRADNSKNTSRKTSGIGRLDRIRRRPADGIFRPKPNHLLGESSSTSLLIRGGNRREAIIPDDADRHDYPKTLGDVCAKTGFAAHPYCSTKDHCCQTARLEEGPRMNTYGQSYD